MALFGRQFNVFERYGRQMDVKTTLYAYSGLKSVYGLNTSKQRWIYNITKKIVLSSKHGLSSPSDISNVQIKDVEN